MQVQIQYKTAINKCNVLFIDEPTTPVKNIGPKSPNIPTDKEL